MKWSIQTPTGTGDPVRAVPMRWRPVEKLHPGGPDAVATPRGEAAACACGRVPPVQHPVRVDKESYLQGTEESAVR